MIKHACGREIFLRRTIQMTTGISLSSKGINPTGRMNLAGDVKTYELFCEHCGTLKNSKDVSLRCFQCGNEFVSDDLFTINGASGVYCRECCEENFEGMRRYNIGGMINKAIILKNTGAE